MSNEPTSGLSIIVSVVVGIPTFWWVCWMAAQLQHGFRWWMIPSIATQAALAYFAIGAWILSKKLLNQRQPPNGRPEDR